MKRVLLAPCLLLLSWSAGTHAAEAPAAEPAAERPKMVCFEQPRTGSNIKRKTCITPEQAEQRRKEDQAAAEGLKRGSAGRSNSNVEKIGVGSR